MKKTLYGVVRPRVSEDEARRALSRKRAGVFLFGRQNVFLTFIELVYLPFYAFQLLVKVGVERQHIRVAMDGLVGNAVFFVDDGLVFEETSRVSFCDFQLDAVEARHMALDGYRGLILEQGLRNRRGVEVGGVLQQDRWYYPFWIGYYRQSKGYDFRSCDGVSGEIQGVRMRRVICSALRSMEANLGSDESNR
jgi:hypothetical protein